VKATAAVDGPWASGYSDRIGFGQSLLAALAALASIGADPLSTKPWMAGHSSRPMKRSRDLRISHAGGRDCDERRIGLMPGRSISVRDLFAGAGLAVTSTRAPKYRGPRQCAAMSNQQDCQGRLRNARQTHLPAVDGEVKALS